MRAAALISIGLVCLGCKSEKKEQPPAPAPVAPAEAPAARAEQAQAAPPAPPQPVPAGDVRTLPVDMDIQGSVANSVGGAIAAVDVQASSGRYVFTIQAKGTSCTSPDGQKDPVLMLTIDGVQMHKWTLESPSFTQLASPGLSLGDGRHHVTVDFINDFYTGPACDRNAWISHLKIVQDTRAP